MSTKYRPINVMITRMRQAEHASRYKRSTAERDVAALQEACVGLQRRLMETEKIMFQWRDRCMQLERELDEAREA